MEVPRQPDDGQRRWADSHSLLIELTKCLATRFGQTGNKQDLDWSIALLRLLVDTYAQDFPGRWAMLWWLAESRSERYRKWGCHADLERAIVLWRDAIALCPRDFEGRYKLLNGLAATLVDRFELQHKMEDLDEVIDLERCVISSLPNDHVDRAIRLRNLAISLKRRFDENGNTSDLNESIELLRASLSCWPGGNSDRPSVLDGLGVSLQTRFEQNGNVADLNEAVQLHREALSLFPHGHPDRSVSLNNLASSLHTRSEQNGSTDDINEAVELHREALSLRPHGHPSRSASLNNLASSLHTRFEQNGSTDDLNEAVELHREALSLRPHGYPDRSSSLSNLAGSLQTRFGQNGSTDDLNEAVELHREALSLFPHGHPGRSSSLNNLAGSLQTRFEQSGSTDDLNEAVELHREALSLFPHGHPGRSSSLDSLASSLRTRFEQNGSTDDLNEAIELHREALSLVPHGHPDRSRLMVNLAGALHTRSQKLDNDGDFEECIRLLMGAADYTFSATLDRLDAAYLWVRYARSRDHDSTLDAYRSAISLLQRALTIRPDLATRHDFLNSKQRYKTLGVDAASYAIEKGDLPAAMELLEQGRALLWSQMRGLRTPLDQLMESNKPLAEGFRDVSSQLDALMTSSEVVSAGSGMERGSARDGRHERHLDEERMERVQRLSKEQEALIGEIRNVPSFEDFLRGASFEKLRQAAAEGPVIIVNHSKFRCDALIVLPREDEQCVNVPLDKDWFSDAVNLCDDLLQARYKHSLGVLSSEYDEVLRRAMAVVWDRVSSNVVQKLEECGVAKESRIWWCPTLFLSALPFHAAGPYEDSSGAEKYFMDDYISSYTPTLTSLIAARSGLSTGEERLLFVGDTKSLRHTKAELDAIRLLRHVDRCLLNSKASSDSVISSLQEAEWVHFACHGRLDPEKPFKSSFALPGGDLTLLDIARTNLRHAEFAFLAACHTAEQRPTYAWDEALHLAAAMQFCGFRSVVGTMWALLDRDGPFLADNVYTHLMMEDLEEGECRFKRAAAAVRAASLFRRDSMDGGEQVMTQRWVNLIHIGA